MNKNMKHKALANALTDIGGALRNAGLGSVTFGTLAKHMLSMALAVDSVNHPFTVLVRGRASRRAAETALLSCFARRQPDGCEFRLLRNRPTVKRGAR